MNIISVGVITISDTGAKGERIDISGPTICELVLAKGWQVNYTSIIPDDTDKICTELIKCAEELNIHLVLTTGGTGFSPRDNTPEATLKVVQKLVPGIPEAMRMLSLQKSPHAILSRATAGIRGSTLIINLPGSPRAVKECLEFIFPALEHGLEILLQQTSNCAQQ